MLRRVHIQTHPPRPPRPLAHVCSVSLAMSADEFSDLESETENESESSACLIWLLVTPSIAVDSYRVHFVPSVCISRTRLVALRFNLRSIDTSRLPAAKPELYARGARPAPTPGLHHTGALAGF
jgi:hypothetical protein